MNPKTIGDFGEDLVAFFLEQKFKKDELLVVRLGAENLPYDLMIPIPNSKTPFRKPTVISVKTRGSWSNQIPPEKETIIKQKKYFKKIGYDFWISFVYYRFVQDKLHFEVYLLDVDDLSYKDDFIRMGKGEQIITKHLKEKARLKFFSAKIS